MIHEATRWRDLEALTVSELQFELQNQKLLLKTELESGSSDEIDYRRTWVLRINQILQTRNFDDENSPLAAKKRLWKAQEQLTYVRNLRDKYIFELRDLRQLPWNRDRRQFLQHRIADLQKQGEILSRITGNQFKRPSTIQTLAFGQKFSRVLTMAVESGNIPDDIKENLIDAIDPSNLATTAGMFAAVAAAHAFPVAGLAADVTLLLYFGTDTALRAYRIYLEINGAIDEADLRAAARVVEQEIAAAGSDKLIELLTWGAARSKPGRAALNKTKQTAQQVKDSLPTDRRGSLGESDKPDANKTTSPEEYQRYLDNLGKKQKEVDAGTKNGDIKGQRQGHQTVAPTRATVGSSLSKNYRKTFFDAHPHLVNTGQKT